MKLTEAQYQIIEQRIVEKIKSEYYLVARKTAALREDKAAFLEYILDFVCEECEVDKQEMRSGSRKISVIYSTRIYAFLARKVSNKKLSYNLIGEFVNKDHASIMHSERKLIEEMEVNRTYREEIKEMEERFISSRKHKISEIHNTLHNEKNY